MVAIADIVVENSRPGVLDRLALGYERLQQINPKIILVSMSAFGRTGPESSYRGYGGTIEAISGIQSLTGYGPDDPPRRIKEMDVTNGIMGACAVITALIHRQSTQQGDWIDLSETESASHGLIGEHLMDYAANGQSRYPLGNRHLEFAPQGCYPCQGEDSWLVLTIQTEAEWQALCKLLGHNDWGSDQRYQSAKARHRYHDEIDAKITAWTQMQPVATACDALQAAGIAAGPVMTMTDLCQDEHLKQRDYYQTPAQAPEQGQYLGFPFRLSKGGGQMLSRGPDLGAHNQEIICKLLGHAKTDLPEIKAESLGTSLDPL
ncbi:MAG: CoA transferase [Phormidesmis sp. RL_2_1]|nr:CoA transferase [Phormidesmis sp. RL_2_1]